MATAPHADTTPFDDKVIVNIADREGGAGATNGFGSIHEYSGYYDYVSQLLMIE